MTTRILFVAVGVCVLYSVTACSGIEPAEGGGSPAGDGTSSAGRTPVSADQFDYDAYLTILRAASGIEDPPETQIVRVLAPEEQPAVWEACMVEAGWQVSVTSDGGLVPPADLPEDQASVYAVADYTCHAQYPVDPALFRSFGEQQIEATYEYYVEELVPCLLKRGHRVEEPPTWASFRSSWVADGRGGFFASEGSWFPYDAVDPASLRDEEWQTLTEECPQSPPAETLFADE